MLAFVEGGVVSFFRKRPPYELRIPQGNPALGKSRGVLWSNLTPEERRSHGWYPVEFPNVIHDHVLQELRDPENKDMIIGAELVTVTRIPFDKPLDQIKREAKSEVDGWRAQRAIDPIVAGVVTFRMGIKNKAWIATLMGAYANPDIRTIAFPALFEDDGVDVLSLTEAQFKVLAIAMFTKDQQINEAYRDAVVAVRASGDYRGVRKAVDAFKTAFPEPVEPKL